MCNVVSPPSAAGTLVSWFSLRSKNVSAVSAPSAAGTLVSWFPPSCNRVSPVRQGLTLV